MSAINLSAVKLEPNQLESFRIDSIVDNSITDFDLFLDVRDHLVLYGTMGYKWAKSELENLLRSGYSEFKIKREDLNRVEMYRRIAMIPTLEHDQAPPERIRSIEQIGATFVKCLHEGDITPAAVEKAKQLTNAMVDCISEDTRCIQALTGLASHDYYTYYHSVRVSCYTLAMAIELGIKDPVQLRDIALGGIFHDIGKREVPTGVLNKAGALTNTEWELMRSHPEKGYESIKDTILSHVSREIIVHHHEKLDGSGYPHGLDRSSLLVEVQIATVADVFDALTSSRCYQQKRSRYEALDFIKHKMLGVKLPTEAFKALIVCLGK